jgi:cytoskeletal protein RodZ
MVCSGPSCPDGNCIGCRNGLLWCGDPRCSPFCSECPIVQDNWSTVVIIVIVIIGLVILLIVVIFYWKANHPAKLTPLTPTTQPTSIYTMPYQYPSTVPSTVSGTVSGSPISSTVVPNLATNQITSSQLTPVSNSTGLVSGRLEF